MVRLQPGGTREWAAGLASWRVGWVARLFGFGRGSVVDRIVPVSPTWRRNGQTIGSGYRDQEIASDLDLMERAIG